MGVDQPGLRPSIPTRRASTSFNVLLSWSLRLHPPAACSSTKQNHPTTRGDLRNRLSFLSGIWTASRNASITRARYTTPLVFRAPEIFFTFVFSRCLCDSTCEENLPLFKLSKFCEFLVRKAPPSELWEDLWENWDRIVVKSRFNRINININIREYIALYLEYFCYIDYFTEYILLLELQLIQKIFFLLRHYDLLSRNRCTPIFAQSSNLSSLPCSLSEILSWSITQFGIYNIYDDEVKERRHLKKNYH